MASGFKDILRWALGWKAAPEIPTSLSQTMRRTSEASTAMRRTTATDSETLRRTSETEPTGLRKVSE